MVVVSSVDQMYACVEEEFVGRVLPFNWAGEKGVYYLEGSKRVGSDF